MGFNSGFKGLITKQAGVIKKLHTGIWYVLVWTLSLLLSVLRLHCV